MNNPRSRRRARPPGTAPTTITFRLEAALVRALEERARARTRSPHALARDYVIATLQREGEPAASAPPELTLLLEGLAAVYDHLLETRKDIALGVAALLTRAGQVKDAEAREWVRKNYPVACSPSPPP
jgi:predicted transcriptional regulator